MSTECTRFRLALEEVLSRRASSEALGWHEHLLGCGPCRELLEAEEALEELLRSLPEPRLPGDLARRVLERLRAARDADALERLLDRDEAPVVPGGLAGRVLAGLEGSREEARLDALLDVLPEPGVPSGLADRILSGLEEERTPSRDNRRGSILPSKGMLWMAAAALLLALFGLRGMRATDPAEPEVARESTPEARVAPALAGVEGAADAPPPAAAPERHDPVDPGLLASLDVLENWEWVTSEDLDLLLAELDEADWALLEYGDEDPEALR